MVRVLLLSLSAISSIRSEARQLSVIGRVFIVENDRPGRYIKCVYVVNMGASSFSETPGQYMNFSTHLAGLVLLEMAFRTLFLLA